MVRISVSYPWTAVSAIAGNLLSPSGSNVLTSTSLMEARR